MCTSLTQHVDDQAELVDVVVAGEEWLGAQQLSENAAQGPHINGLRVLLTHTKWRTKKNAD